MFHQRIKNERSLDHCKPWRMLTNKWHLTCTDVRENGPADEKTMLEAVLGI